MKLYARLPIRLQRFIAVKVNNYGYHHNNHKLVVWGLTHFPITFEDEE